MKNLKKETLERFDASLKRKKQKDFEPEGGSFLFHIANNIISNAIIQLENIELIYIHHVRVQTQLAFLTCD